MFIALSRSSGRQTVLLPLGRSSIGSRVRFRLRRRFVSPGSVESVICRCSFLFALVFRKEYLKIRSICIRLLGYCPLTTESVSIRNMRSRRSDSQINPPDHHHLPPASLRSGLCALSGSARQPGNAFNMHAVKVRSPICDFCRRSRLDLRYSVANLIRAGAPATVFRQRRQLLWQLGDIDHRPDEMALDLPADSVDPAHACCAGTDSVGITNRWDFRPMVR